MRSKAGWPGTRFRDLRRTHASLLLQAGANPKIVQERPGHESITTTMDTYSHVIPALQQESAQKLGDLFERRFGYQEE